MASSVRFALGGTRAAATRGRMCDSWSVTSCADGSAACDWAHSRRTSSALIENAVDPDVSCPSNVRHVEAIVCSVSASSEAAAGSVGDAIGWTADWPRAAASERRASPSRVDSAASMWAAVQDANLRCAGWTARPRLGAGIRLLELRVSPYASLASLAS